MSDLQTELRQARPFRSAEEEVYLSVQRTAAVLLRDLGEVLRAHGLTPTQYNVLRILRGAGPCGLCRFEVGERLLAPVPDVTRLLDRLETAGLLARARDGADRRRVTTRITDAGLDVTARLDAEVDAFHRRRLGHLGPDALRTLADLLGTARDGS